MYCEPKIVAFRDILFPVSFEFLLAQVERHNGTYRHDIFLRLRWRGPFGHPAFRNRLALATQRLRQLGPRRLRERAIVLPRPSSALALSYLCPVLTLYSLTL